MKLRNILAIAAIIALTVSSCRGKQTVTPSFSTFKFETSCLGTNADGSQTLRAYGNAADKAKAIEEAKKNAVYDVIFKGTQGGGTCNQPALVNEVNARERYAAYFDRFFANGGEYRNFVRESSTKDDSRIESKGTSRVNYGVVVDVDRPGLRRQLVSDGILSR